MSEPKAQLLFDCRVRIQYGDETQHDLISTRNIPLTKPFKSVENLGNCQVAMVKTINAVTDLVEKLEPPIELTDDKEFTTKLHFRQFIELMSKGILNTKHTWMWVAPKSGNHHIHFELETV